QEGKFLDIGPLMWCHQGFNELMLEEARRWRVKRKVWLELMQKSPSSTGTSRIMNEDNVVVEAGGSGVQNRLQLDPHHNEVENVSLELWPDLFYHDVIETYETNVRNIFLQATFRPVYIIEMDQAVTNDEKNKPRLLRTPFVKDCLPEGELIYSLDCPPGDFKGGIRFAETAEDCQRFLLKSGANTALFSDKSMECWAWNCMIADRTGIVVYKDQPGNDQFTEKIFRVLSTFCEDGRGQNDVVSRFHSPKWQFAVDRRNSYGHAERHDRATSSCVLSEDKQLRLQVLQDRAHHQHSSTAGKIEGKPGASVDVSAAEQELLQTNSRRKIPGSTAITTQHEAQASRVLNEKIQNTLAKIRVACVLLAVWPHEEAEMRAHSVVTAPYCDEAAFVIANKTVVGSGTSGSPTDDGTASFSTYNNVPVRNLAKSEAEGGFSMAEDVWRQADKMPNTVEKFHTSILDAERFFFQERKNFQQNNQAATNAGPQSDESPGADEHKQEDALHYWYCFIESDVAFFPENFKRFLLLKNLATEQTKQSPLYVGQTWAHSVFQDGFLTEPSQGTCLNQIGLRQLVLFLQDLRQNRQQNPEVRDSGKKSAILDSTWPPAGLDCDPFAKEQHTEVLLIANTCFRNAGLRGIAPADARDSVGRLFWADALDSLVRLSRNVGEIRMKDIVTASTHGKIGNAGTTTIARRGGEEDGEEPPGMQLQVEATSTTGAAKSHRTSLGEILQNTDEIFRDRFGSLVYNKPQHYTLKNNASAPFWLFFEGSNHLWERCAIDQAQNFHQPKQDMTPQMNRQDISDESGVQELAEDASRQLQRDGSSGSTSITRPEPKQNAIVTPKPVAKSLVSKYPVAFHPHRSLASGRTQVRQSKTLWKANFSLLAVHELVRKRTVECPGAAGEGVEAGSFCLGREDEESPRVFGSGGADEAEAVASQQPIEEVETTQTAESTELALVALKTRRGNVEDPASTSQAASLLSRFFHCWRTKLRKTTRQLVAKNPESFQAIAMENC
ncbi:unnamed protein product, partial [Amoebophrya sp. A120]